MKTYQLYDIEKCSELWLKGLMSWRTLLATVRL